MALHDRTGGAVRRGAESADAALKFVVDLFLAPPLEGEAVRKMMDDRSSDPIGHFASVCREEMRSLGLG